jgi:hypothetical protein
MANNDPNGWAKSPGFNSWGHLGVAKDNDFYKLLDETKKQTDSLFETVNLVFELVNSALDFIASLLIDFTNPLKPIIEEIIALLESFVADLRNLGWYITYDKYELNNTPTENLLGGYPAFEQRLIKKLLDQGDPTRPNFSAQSKVFALTFFAGADVSSLSTMITAIRKLLNLFLGSGKENPIQAPVNVDVAFYNNYVGEINLPNNYEPDGIRVKWKLPPPNSTNKAFPKRFLLPDYFVISVATRKSKDKISIINTVRREATDPKIKTKGDTKSNLLVLPESHLLDPKLWPLFENKSITKLSESETFEPLDVTPSGIGSGGSWVIKSGVGDDVYLNAINDEPISDIYKVFIYGSGGDSVIGDDDFSFDIPLDNLKVQGQLKEEYNVTMYSLTMPKEDFEKLNIVKKDLPIFRGLSLNVGTHIEVESADFMKAINVGTGSVSFRPQGKLTLPSRTISVKTPSTLKSKYLKAIRFFFLSYLLARLDTRTQREILGLEDDIIFGFTPEDITFIKKYTKSDDGIGKLRIKALNKQEFAKETIKWIDDVMRNFKQNLPKDSILQGYVSTLNKVENFKFDLYEMLQFAAKGGGLNEGIFPREQELKVAPSSIVVSLDEYRSNYESLVGDKDSYKGSDFINQKIPPRASPIIYYPNGEKKFFGQLTFVKGFPDLVKETKLLLTLGNVAEEEGNWINQKPFRDTDLSSLLEVLDLVKKFVDGFLKGLEGIVAQILKYIHILKTRIAELQAVIAKIKALIDLILSFRLPLGLYGAYHLTNGTAGLVNALQQSKDKPDIGVNGYGTGAMVVLGGAPAILVDLLIALMGGNPTVEEG